MMKKERFKRVFAIVSLFLFAVAALILPIGAQEVPGNEGGEVKVKSIRTVKRYGKSLDWSRERDLIVSARLFSRMIPWNRNSGSSFSSRRRGRVIACRISSIRRVPSRHGMHFPQLSL